MHLVFFLRGLVNQTDLWKSFAMSQYFKWTRKNMDTEKEEITLIQAGLRDSVMGTMEYIFPKEALPYVLSMMGFKEWSDKAGNKFMNKARLKVLRRTLGVKKIPKKVFHQAAGIPESILLTASERGLSHLRLAGVSIHLIGIKDDVMGDMEDKEYGHHYWQEML